MLQFTRREIDTMEKLSEKTLQRQAKIKQVALNMFLEKGYEATNLKDIVKLSGGSLSSIYAAYQSKENLFMELVKDRIEKDMQNIKKIANQKYDNVYDFLLNIATYMIKTLNDKESIGLIKIVHSRIYSPNSNILKMLKEFENDYTIELIQEAFKRFDADFAVKNANLLAHMFLDTIRIQCLYKITLREERIMSKEEQDNFARFIVDFFTKTRY
ncbi:MAG TPA: TetR/AcrR family transcriptional regulator [Campylobacter avium]|uniref:TetR/AcrR family transcriptional regulator n=1 Tax=Campylobacter avium TaxID=522485 RepID=UPI001DB2F697|nr:TetR/AcrR family transcriptional regulator [Campylobacter avium]HJE65584.1 TetR/AcrR family transcriptional regulator [Campylobacter avium]